MHNPYLYHICTVGDDAHVRHSRSGPKWQAAAVLASTGPVSYLLSAVTPQGVRRWMRHQTHICNDITAELNLPFGGRRQELPAQVPLTDLSDQVDSTSTTQSEPADTTSTAANVATRRDYTAQLITLCR
ncbi:hypothetical protein MRX96_017059 [Rhipicephalus microplus]